MNAEQSEKLRIHRFILQTIRKFNLDLCGLSIFTEAASGVYMYTPLIAALAGATKVYAIAVDSKYGKKEKIRNDIVREAEILGVAERVDIVFEKIGEGLRQSDIITNSGFVRPIDANMVANLKHSAVIPLMWEAWELRPEELDITACRSHGVLVMGTNEHHPSLNLFRSIGFKVCKLLFAAGYSVYRDKYLLISSGEYGKSIADFFMKTGVLFDQLDLDRYSSLNRDEWIQKYKDIYDKLETYDAVIVAELDNDVRIISEDGVIPASLLKKRNPLLRIVYICGVVDKESIDRQELDIYPESTGKFRHISVTADYLGWKPVLELNTAGLKVGEAMARARVMGQSLEEAERCALENSPADPLIC